MYRDKNFNVHDSYNDDNGGLASNTHEDSDGDSDDEPRKTFSCYEHRARPIANFAHGGIGCDT